VLWVGRRRGGFGYSTVTDLATGGLGRQSAKPMNCLGSCCSMSSLSGQTCGIMILCGGILWAISNLTTSIKNRRRLL